MSSPIQYYDLARYLVDRLGADAVALVVVNGPEGSDVAYAKRDVVRAPKGLLQAAVLHGLRYLIERIEAEPIAPPTDPNNPPS